MSVLLVNKSAGFYLTVWCVTIKWLHGTLIYVYVQMVPRDVMSSGLETDKNHFSCDF